MFTKAETMKTSLTPKLLALTAALSCLAAATPARAGLVAQTAAAAFDFSASVGDAEGGSATSQTNVVLGSAAVSQFNPTLGVLTGASVQLNSTRTQATQVQSTAGGGTGAGNNEVTSYGTGSSSARLTAAGVDTGFAAQTVGDSCTEKWKKECTGSPTTSAAATNGSFAAAAGALGSYVGTGTTAVGFGASSISAQQLSNVFSGTETTTSRLQWAGDAALRYDYLLHAAASFAEGGTQTVLDLDFGTVDQGSSAMLGFGLFNLAGADRAGLDLDAIVGTGDTSQLGTDLGLFDDLAAGEGNLFQALLDTSAAGDFAATYWLTLSDADIGAAESRYSYTLQLNLHGQVRDAATDGDPGTRNDVPEPGSLALALAALGATGFAGRRRLRR
jgi:hypothetical protein